MTKKMEEALNAQINAELWSAYLYLSMAANFHAAGLDGIANWFDVQFKEEQDHAAILYNYMLSRDGRVILKPIDAVKADWATPLEAFEDTLEHEKKVTAMINNIYAIALDENDYATQNRMQWFIDEQVEGRGERTQTYRHFPSDKGQWLCALHDRQRVGGARLHAGFATGYRRQIAQLFGKKRTISAPPIGRAEIFFRLGYLLMSATA